MVGFPFFCHTGEDPNPLYANVGTLSHVLSSSVTEDNDNDGGCGVDKMSSDTFSKHVACTSLFASEQKNM